MPQQVMGLVLPSAEEGAVPMSSKAAMPGAGDYDADERL